MDNVTIRQTLFNQADSVNFSLDNYANGKDNGKIIYITDDPDYNKLQLSIQNNLTKSIPLAAVDLTLDNLNSGKIPLVIQIDGLSNSEVQAIQATQGKLDGKTISFNSAILNPDSSTYLLCIAPTQDQTIDANQTLVISLIHVMASDADQGTASMDITLNDKEYPLITGISIASPAPKDLTDSLDISFVLTDNSEQGGHDNEADVVYICGSEATCTKDLDDNTLILQLKNKTSQPLTQNANNAKFSISFPVSTSPDVKGALCTPDDLDHISVELGSHDTSYDWKKHENKQGNYVTWDLYPQNPAVLPANGSVYFYIESIMSHLSAGTASLTVHWYNIPEYKDDNTTLTIQKQVARPTIKNFTISENPYTAYIDPYEKKAYFAYDVYGAENWKLTITPSNGSGSPFTKTLSCSRNAGYMNPNLLPGKYSATLEGM